MSDAAKEFSARLQQCLESTPGAPPGTYGRLTWLQRQLEQHAGLKVSVNTVHKWVNGAALPRPDNIATLAKLLQVDVVWLQMGRKPGAPASTVAVESAKTTGAVMLLAGAIEVAGGRVTFPEGKDELPHLWANIGNARFGVIVVGATFTQDAVSFIVPEPVGQSRVVAAVPAQNKAGHTFALDLLDLTGMPKQSFGGFSVVQLLRTKANGYATSEGVAVKPMPSVSTWDALVKQ